MFKNTKIMRQKVIFFITALLIVLASGCKEPPVKQSTKKKPQTRDMAQVSANIDRLTETEFDRPERDTAQKQRTQNNEAVINLNEMITDETAALMPVSMERVPFSQFRSDFEPRIIRVSILTRGLPRSQIETIENRILDLIGTHAPQPFELRKSASIDKHDNVWGHLHIDYHRQTIRLRKTSKTAPLRAAYKFSLDMHLSAHDDQSISWHDWSYKWQDENTVANETAVNAHFWKRLEREIPMLTAIQTDETEQWLRAQGLAPQILSGDLSATKLSAHQYWPQGCIVESTNGKALVRQLAKPYAPPQQLSVDPLLMQCQGNAAFIVTSESANRIALYYHSDHSTQAWKSMLSFQTPVKKGDLGMYIDDDVICLYTGADPVQARTVEFQCIDRKNGILRWRIAPIPGVLRGFAVNRDMIYIAGDQMLASIKKDGTDVRVKKLQTGGRQKNYLSCQFKDRMVFTTSASHLVSYRFDTGEIDWETSLLDPARIHCSQAGVLLVSEAGGYLLAFDIDDHKPIWKYRTVTAPRDILTYGDIIYLLLDRAIVALVPATGTVKAQIPMIYPANRFIQSAARLYLDTEDAVYTWR